MPCLTTLVADLACRVKGTSIGGSAITGNVSLSRLKLTSTHYLPELTYQFSACIALHGLRLTVTSIVVRPTTFVASCRAWTASHSRKASSKAASYSTTRRNSSAASTICRSGLKTCIWARSLWITVSENDGMRNSGNVLLDDPVGHKNSNVHLQCRHHLCAESGSPLEHGQGPDNGSIA